MRLPLDDFFAVDPDAVDDAETEHDQQRLDPPQRNRRAVRSEEHTSELQSRSDLVCRLLLEKKNNDDSVLQTHQHDVVYYGVVNLVDNNYIMGAVDVWRCRGCNQLFCEDKKYGMTDLAPEVGLPKIEPNTQWAALICTRDKGSNWTLTQVKPGMTIAHSCTPDTKVELTLGPRYDLAQGPASGIGKHRIIVIEKFVNLAVDVQTC